jgi:hypothetical protein
MKLAVSYRRDQEHERSVLCMQTTRIAKDRTQSRPDLLVKELGVSGFRLVEEIPRHEPVIAVHSYSSRDTNVGQIRESDPEDLEDALHALSSHGANFAIPLELPKEASSQTEQQENFASSRWTFIQQTH